MENKNTGLKIMVVILCLLVVGLSGYIVYDKVLSDEKENVQDMNGNENNNENKDGNDVFTSNHVELDENTKSELKKVFKFVYDYYDWGNAYCGTYGQGGIESNGVIHYTVSGQYSSYNEMINHLKEYMTEHVIYGVYSMSSDTYIEKDGKLYCPDFGKGDSLYQLEDISIKNSNPYETHIYTTIETKLVYEDTMYETYKVTFEKRDNRWIISSYEKQD